jgi:hypothetical protein
MCPGLISVSLQNPPPTLEGNFTKLFKEFVTVCLNKEPDAVGLLRARARSLSLSLIMAALLPEPLADAMVWVGAQRPTVKDLLKHKFVSKAKKNSHLVEWITRYRKWKESRKPGENEEDSDSSDEEAYVVCVCSVVRCDASEEVFEAHGRIGPLICRFRSDGRPAPKLEDPDWNFGTVRGVAATASASAGSHGASAGSPSGGGGGGSKSALDGIVLPALAQVPPAVNRFGPNQIPPALPRVLVVP